MILLYIILLTIIIGGAIYNSRHESFMCNNRYKRVRFNKNGKNTYKFLTNVKSNSNYKMYDTETKIKCRYKTQQLCGSDEPRDCLLYRNDNILRCSTTVDMTPNSTCYCNNDCCSNRCINNKCVNMIKSNFDTYGYKPSNLPNCRKK
jgi:hypothetical protein